MDIHTSADPTYENKLNNAHILVAVDYLIDFLRVADEYILEDVKNECQHELIQLIDESTYHIISEMGELYSADRIVEYCQWYWRNKSIQYNLNS